MGLIVIMMELDVNLRNRIERSVAKPKEIIRVNSEYMVSTDMVYQEVMNEMRHHRAAQFSTATWNSAILLAVIGGIVAVKTDLVDRELPCLNYSPYFVIKFLVLVFILFMTISTIYSIYYSHRRYVDMREYARENFFLKVKKTALDYVEDQEPKIFKAIKLYLFLMIGTGLLGAIGIYILLD